MAGNPPGDSRPMNHGEVDFYKVQRALGSGTQGHECDLFFLFVLVFGGTQGDLLGDAGV